MSKRKTSMAAASRAKAAAKARLAPTGDRATEDQTTEDQISYSALSLFERCSYRYYVERIAGLHVVHGQAQALRGGLTRASDAGQKKSPLRGSA